MAMVTCRVEGSAAPGTWHAIPFPLTERAVFWVVFRTGTAQGDLEVVDLERERRLGFRVSLGDDGTLAPPRPAGDREA